MDILDRSLLDEMLSEIVCQTTQLADMKRRMFLAWLKSHCAKAEALQGVSDDTQSANESTMSCEGCLTKNLKVWFESLAPAKLLWEYRLLMAEIVWWRGLDEERLVHILDVGRRE